MSGPVIPIHCERPPVAEMPTRVVGEALLAQRVLAALQTAVQAQLPNIGPTSRWLRELRLLDGEAYAQIAPGLGCDGMDSGDIAFDTLRRLLPDTDIYVGAAPD